MRFRLGTAGYGAGAATGAEGVGNGMRNLFMLPMLKAQAAEEAQTAGAKQRLLESQIADHVAQAALRRNEADALGSAPDVLGTVIAGRAGTDVPTFNRWRESVKTGVQPTTGSATGFPEIDEQIGIKPQPAIDPAVAAKLVTEFQRFAPGLVNPKDFKMNDTAQAMGHYQKQDVLDQVLAGRAAPATVGQSVAATEGKPLVDNITDTGVGFNKFTGQGTLIDQGLRALFGDKRQSEITENNAQAGSARAAAGAHSASAGLANARRERVVGGYDKPVTILDEDSGVANITRIPTGAEPVTVGVAPRKSTGTDATNAKERNRVVRDVEKEMRGAPEAEIAAEVDRRMGRRGSAPTPGKPAAAPAAPPAPDMTKAADIKAKVKAGTLTREQGIAQLRALGFK